jgi:hypothetical protein
MTTCPYVNESKTTCEVCKENDRLEAEIERLRKTLRTVIDYMNGGYPATQHSDTIKLCEAALSVKGTLDND